MQKHGFVIHCLEKKIELRTDGAAKQHSYGNRIMSISAADPIQQLIMADLMNLVEQVIWKTEYHIDQAQVEVNLAKRTAEILVSSSTRSAQDAYTWWDWVFRGCVITSALIFTFTLIQCCYLRHLIHSLRISTHASLVLSPLQLPQGRP